MGCCLSKEQLSIVTEQDDGFTGVHLSRLPTTTSEDPPIAEVAARANAAAYYGNQDATLVALKRGIVKFNVNPKQGIEYLTRNGLLSSSPEAVARFLFSGGRLEDGRGCGEPLSKTSVGEYIGSAGKDDESRRFHRELLEQYTRQFSFSGRGLLPALRLFLAAFRLPGEAQVIDRLMTRFADVYYRDNPPITSGINAASASSSSGSSSSESPYGGTPGSPSAASNSSSSSSSGSNTTAGGAGGATAGQAAVPHERLLQLALTGGAGLLRSPDAAYVLAFGAIMLNTDLHKANLNGGGGGGGHNSRSGHEGGAGGGVGTGPDGHKSGPNSHGGAAGKGRDRRMTRDQFIRNMSGVTLASGYVEGGQDIAAALFGAVYDDLWSTPLAMEVGSAGAGPAGGDGLRGVTFTAPAKQGWLWKKGSRGVRAWKRRYFLLTDGCLYYFSSPSQVASAQPRCILPLDNAEVQALGGFKGTTLRIFPTEDYYQDGLGGGADGGDATDLQEGDGDDRHGLTGSGARSDRRGSTLVHHSGPGRPGTGQRGAAAASVVKVPTVPLLKSAKRLSNGTLTRGQHTEFVLRASTTAERNGWLAALSQHTVRAPMQRLRRQSTVRAHGGVEALAVIYGEQTAAEVVRRQASMHSVNAGDAVRRQASLSARLASSAAAATTDGAGGNTALGPSASDAAAGAAGMASNDSSGRSSRQHSRSVSRARDGVAAAAGIGAIERTVSRPASTVPKRSAGASGSTAAGGAATASDATATMGARWAEAHHDALETSLLSGGSSGVDGDETLQEIHDDDNGELPHLFVREPHTSSAAAASGPAGTAQGRATLEPPHSPIQRQGSAGSGLRTPAATRGPNGSIASAVAGQTSSAMASGAVADVPGAPVTTVRASASPVSPGDSVSQGLLAASSSMHGGAFAEQLQLSPTLPSAAGAALAEAGSAMVGNGSAAGATVAAASSATAGTAAAGSSSSSAGLLPPGLPNPQAHLQLLQLAQQALRVHGMEEPSIVGMLHGQSVGTAEPGPASAGMGAGGATASGSRTPAGARTPIFGHSSPVAAAGAQGFGQAQAQGQTHGYGAQGNVHGHSHSHGQHSHSRSHSGGHGVSLSSGGLNAGYTGGMPYGNGGLYSDGRASSAAFTSAFETASDVSSIGEDMDGEGFGEDGQMGFDDEPLTFEDDDGGDDEDLHDAGDGVNNHGRKRGQVSAMPARVPHAHIRSLSGPTVTDAQESNTRVATATPGSSLSATAAPAARAAASAGVAAGTGSTASVVASVTRPSPTAAVVLRSGFTPQKGARAGPGGHAHNTSGYSAGGRSGPTGHGAGYVAGADMSQLQGDDEEDEDGQDRFQTAYENDLDLEDLAGDDREDDDGHSNYDRDGHGDRQAAGQLKHTARHVLESSRIVLESGRSALESFGASLRAGAGPNAGFQRTLRSDSDADVADGRGAGMPGRQGANYRPGASAGHAGGMAGPSRAAGYSGTASFNAGPLQNVSSMSMSAAAGRQGTAIAAMPPVPPSAARRHQQAMPAFQGQRPLDGQNARAISGGQGQAEGLRAQSEGQRAGGEGQRLIRPPSIHDRVKLAGGGGTRPTASVSGQSGVGTPVAGTVATPQAGPWQGNTATGSTGSAGTAAPGTAFGSRTPTAASAGSSLSLLSPGPARASNGPAAPSGQATQSRQGQGSTAPPIQGPGGRDLNRGPTKKPSGPDGLDTVEVRLGLE